MKRLKVSEVIGSAIVVLTAAFLTWWYQVTFYFDQMGYDEGAILMGYRERTMVRIAEDTHFLSWAAIFLVPAAVLALTRRSLALRALAWCVIGCVLGTVVAARCLIPLKRAEIEATLGDILLIGPVVLVFFVGLGVVACAAVGRVPSLLRGVAERLQEDLIVLIAGGVLIAALLLLFGRSAMEPSIAMAGGLLGRIIASRTATNFHPANGAQT